MHVNDQNHLTIQSGSSTIDLSPPAGIRLSENISAVDTLIIRHIRAANAEAAVNIYSDPKRTQPVHLFIDRKEEHLVQMVPFNRKAGFNWKFNKTAISLGLITPGDLLTSEKHQDFFYHKGNFTPKDYLYAFGNNDSHYRWWATYPPTQLDLLLQISLILIDEYGITKIQVYEDLVASSLEPGPAFPKVSFQETIKREKESMGLDLQILEETKENVKLKNHPDDDVNAVEYASTADKDFKSDLIIPKNSRVAVIEENSGWSLVEIIDEIEGQSWLKGWMKSSVIKMGKYTPVVVKHKLFAGENRSYKFIKAADGNYDRRVGSNQPKFIIIHFTTGTDIRQTINTFRDPDAGVSTHLIIGRDGRVIQCVPFDHAAQHCGFSYWEDNGNLNKCTIGIEIDNAGFLSKSWDGKWVRKHTVIPTEKVTPARHVKDFSIRHWEGFTLQQLEATFAIVAALKAAYPIQDILGHDDINIKFRRDPGPLFKTHMANWRDKLFKRKHAAFTQYQTISENDSKVTLYRDHLGKPPDLNHPLVEGVRLKAKQMIRIVDDFGYWSQIRVAGRIGWVESKYINTLSSGRTKITHDDLPFYQILTRSDAAPPPTAYHIKLSSKQIIRVQKEKHGMALIVTKIPIMIEDKEEERLIEGWVQVKDIKRVFPLESTFDPLSAPV